jgi:hypothetical protein
MQVGQTPDIEQPNGWWYYLSVSLRFGLGLPLLAFGLGGLAVIVARDWRKALLLLSFPAAYFALAGSLRLLFVRYALPVVPFLCISAAIAVTALVSRITARRPSARGALAALVALVVVAPSARSVILFNRIVAQRDNRVLVSEWIERHAPHGSSLLQSGSQYGHAQFHPGHYRIWKWDKPRRMFLLDGRPVEGRPDWILLQESPLPSRTQEVVEEFLRSGYQLVATFRALDVQERANVYDVQDAFFVPFAGFRHVERPGPNFVVYKHQDAAFFDGSSLR